MENTIKGKIAEFLEKQKSVYKIDHKRIQRDARAAKRVTGDHLGRWFFELFQNCDDALAKSVFVKLTNTAVYVADDGNGVEPEAVESISGTDLSDKTDGAIGHKGIGFKAVFEISDNPQIFTNHDDGLEFNRERSLRWIKINGLSEKDWDIPFQWLPFGLSRKSAECQDSTLASLSSFKTVVKLPIKSGFPVDDIIQQLRSWPPFSLIPFNNVSCLKVDGLGLSFEYSREPGKDKFLLSNNNGSVTWSQSKSIISAPRNLLKQLNPEERTRLFKAGVLVACPSTDTGLLESIKENIPLHVYYPTENLSPVGLLLHADFRVKGDRSSIISPKHCRYNKWLLGQLSEHLIDFINNEYNENSPANNIKLLEKCIDLEGRPVSNFLWDSIKNRAQAKLLLPNIAGDPILPLGQAGLFSFSKRTDLARLIIGKSNLAPTLLHASFDEGKNAKHALVQLGIQT